LPRYRFQGAISGCGTPKQALISGKRPQAPQSRSTWKNTLRGFTQPFVSCQTRPPQAQPLCSTMRDQRHGSERLKSSGRRAASGEPSTARDFDNAAIVPQSVPAIRAGRRAGEEGPIAGLRNA